MSLPQFGTAEPGKCHLHSIHRTEAAALAAVEAGRADGLELALVRNIDEWADEMERAQVGDVTRCTEAEFFDALGVLPPEDWHTFQGVELFCIGEATVMRVHRQYGRIGDCYATKNVILGNRETYLTPSEILDLYPAPED